MLTNEELKKKFVEILEEGYTPIEYDDGDWGQTYFPTNEDVADALIAAVIDDVKDLQAQVNVLEMTNIFLQAGYDDAEGDRLYWVNKYKEAEHRADVAERALRNAAPRLNCRGGLGKGFCKVDKCDYYHCNNDDGCVKAHLDQAEKELAEERK